MVNKNDLQSVKQEVEDIINKYISILELTDWDINVYIETNSISSEDLEYIDDYGRETTELANVRSNSAKKYAEIIINYDQMEIFLKYYDDLHNLEFTVLHELLHIVAINRDEVKVHLIEVIKHCYDYKESQYFENEKCTTSGYFVEVFAPRIFNLYKYLFKLSDWDFVFRSFPELPDDTTHIDEDDYFSPNACNTFLYRYYANDTLQKAIIYFNFDLISKQTFNGEQSKCITCLDIVLGVMIDIFIKRDEELGIDLMVKLIMQYVNED